MDGLSSTGSLSSCTTPARAWISVFSFIADLENLIGVVMSRCGTSMIPMGVYRVAIWQVLRGPKFQNRGAGLTDSRTLVQLFVLECESTSLVEAKSKPPQFLATWYPADLEEYWAAACEEVARTDVLFEDLDVEGVWNMTYLTVGRNLGCLASIHGDYGRLPEVW